MKKPGYRDLLDWEKEFNKQINKIRHVIEQTIANFKTWRIILPTTEGQLQHSLQPSQP